MKNIAKFFLFVYTEYIKEEWDIYKPFTKVIIFPFWFIRSFLIWLVCPLLIPDYLIRKSKIYKKFQKVMDLNYKEINELNKLNTQNFLDNRYSGKTQGNGPKLK
jgi:uncharacterized BrkB/YihY/UPF0761 family membrane protein